MVSVATQFDVNVGRGFSESETGARLRNSRLNNSNSNRDQDFVDGLSGNISKPIQEIKDKRIREFTKKQELNFKRRVEATKQKIEEDQFAQDIEAVYRAYEANKYMVPVHAIRAAIRSRQAVKNHAKHAWILPFAIAIGMDGIFSFIPVIGSFLLVFGYAYLLFFLLGTGTKMKARIWRFLFWLGAFLFEVCIPFMKILTFSTVLVYMYYRKSKKAEEKGEKNLREIQDQYPNLIVE